MNKIMHLYIPTGGDTVKLFDTEKYKLDYIPYDYLEVRTASVDGSFVDVSGNKVEVKAGDLLFSKGDFISTLDGIANMLNVYKIRREECCKVSDCDNIRECTTVCDGAPITSCN